MNTAVKTAVHITEVLGAKIWSVEFFCKIILQFSVEYFNMIIILITVSSNFLSEISTVYTET